VTASRGSRGPRGSRWSAWSRWLPAASLALALGAGGCATTDRTKIERGEAYVSGTQSFDAFFEEVVALRQDAGKATGERGRAEGRLKGALGVSVDDLDAILDATRARAKELEGKGTLLRLQVVPDVKVLGGKGAPANEKLAQDVEEVVRIALALTAQMRGLRAKAHALELRRAVLAEEAPKVLAKDLERRPIVERELLAAKQVIAEAKAESEREAGLAAYFVLELAFALDATQPDPAPPPSPALPSATPAPGPTTKPTPAPKPGPSTKPGPKPGGQPGPGPAPKPKPKPKPSGDFDP
jgi:hypothetical protein